MIEPATDAARSRLEREIQAAYPGLLALLKRLTGRQEIAQELCQDAIVRLIEQPPGSVLDVRSWLFRTATHLAWDWLRRQRVQRDHAQISVPGEGVTADASRVAAAVQSLSRLRAALVNLPKQARRVFELSRFGELSQNEIAARLGIERKTVENHLTRALALLAKALGEGNDRQH